MNDSMRERSKEPIDQPTNQPSDGPSDKQTDGRAQATLRELLWSEQAAVEAYRQAIERADSGPAAVLRKIWSAHWDAVDILGDHLRQSGGEPEAAAEPVVWHAIESTGGGMFDRLAAAELQQVARYEAVFDESDLTADTQDLIRSTLLPRTLEHVDALAEMAAGVESYEASPGEPPGASQV